MEQTDTLSRVQALDVARPVLIWGAGRAGITAARYLRDRRIEPVAFIDSAPRPDLPEIEGLRVHPPAHLLSLRDQGQTPFVVVASMHAAEITRHAETLGVSAPADLGVLQTSADAFPGVTDPLVPNFYTLLHELRGHALADMPPGAQAVLSAGCSGRWYFDWVEAQYGRVDRHIGAEAFMPRPDGLPDNVEWLARDVINMPEVAENSIDLAFSGQNIEHLWPEQVAGFLLESHRVLAPGGWLVVDSPNREMTRPLIWTHPEHTIEYSVDDIRELLDLAGFADITVRGIWLVRDRDRLLPLSPFERGPSDSMEVLRRSALARTRPESSFLWWAEARKRHAPRVADLSRALARMFASAWPERLNRFVVPGPTRIDADGRRWAMLNAGERGIIADGPLFPLRAGRSCLRFRVRGLSGSAPCAVRLDLTRGLGDRETPIASTTVACGDEGGVAEVEVVLTDEMTFGFRTRLYNVGGGAGEVLLACDHLQDTTR